MNFSEALNALNDGKRMERTAWEADGEWDFVVRQNGYPDGIAINKNTAEATGLREGTVWPFQPYLMGFTVEGSFAPYLPSQSDLFAEDWQEI